MPRQANAIDFWRGFALITIFVNHIPGLIYSHYTHGNISILDSADLFVFLAGWSVRLAVGRPGREAPMSQVVFRLGGRAIVLYLAQVTITLVAIAVLAATALLLNNPLILEWHNAAAVFYDPVPTHIGLATLTHQLGYFDILPLYVALMVFAPLIAAIDRYTPHLLLPLSFLLYVLVLTFRLIPPTWPVAGHWFFNPLAWQFIFVLGFVLAKDSGIGGVVRRHIFWIRIVAAVLVVGGILIVLKGWWPDPTKVPHPRLFFISDKTFLTPIRVIQFLSLVAVFSVVFPYLRTLPFIKSVFAPIIPFLSMLGRNSLPVFCIGSLLSLSGQIVRLIWKGSVGADTVVLILGVAIMALTAWLAEWRDRAKDRSPARPPPQSAPASS